ncbi:MBL fold metallo-hydrolase [Thalassolituus sp. LLYu03]|uniref:MBL fold metallo-hydrolase n=1 Tax=Thalassolituus sp. LLYu03 TaxID=3421656 RepID=UPI003D2B306B
MRYTSLGSGSRGNATLVVEQDKALLIDCGFSRKVLFSRLEMAGLDVRQLDGIFVTHEHGDHARGVVSVCEALNIPFYASFGTARAMQWLEHPLWRCIASDEVVSAGALAVMPVVVPHDAEEPLQFVVENAAGSRLGVLSDLGSLTAHIVSAYQGCHALQLEANHDPDMLRSGPYPPSLQARVAGNFGHLSNQQCAELIYRLQWDGLRYVTAGHISEKNNARALVSQALCGVLGCAPGDVRLLEQDQISDWLQL